MPNFFLMQLAPILHSQISQTERFPETETLSVTQNLQVHKFIRPAMDS